MAVTIHGGTMPGGTTPMCNDCGVSLCWDISRTEYLEAKAFWDAWCCRDCSPDKLSAHGWCLLNGREALPAAVAALVATFEQENADLVEDPSCREPLDTARTFAAILSDAGIRSDVVEIAQVRGRAHHGVTVGDFTIDWHAGAHDEDAPVPLVFRTSLGWPIEPATTTQLLERLSKLDPAQLQALIAEAIGSR